MALQWMSPVGFFLWCKGSLGEKEVERKNNNKKQRKEVGGKREEWASRVGEGSG